jgi:ubiquinone/menaquinone biosynthesis C-methylase UbiE
MDNSNAAFNSRYFGEPSKNSDSFGADTVKRLAQYKKKYLVTFINGIPKGGTLLDLGCGKGKTVRLVQFLRPDIQIIATDITDMREFLPEGTVFHKVSADELSLVCGDASVDAVISEHVIEHIVYPNTMFEGIFKVLKQSGRVFIETPNWTRLFLPFSPLYFWNDYTHIHPYSVMALRRAFIEYALKEECVKSVSSIEWGKRFMQTRVEDGKIKTGVKPAGKVFKPKDSLGRKIFNAFLDLTIHPLARDILIGIARKP